MKKLRYVGACEHGTWHLMIHPPGEPQSARPVRFKCRSWRHEGECRKWKGAQDFVRIRSAIQAHKHWSFLTLTFAQKEWPDWTDQFEWACPYWSMLRQRLGRKYGKIPYIQLWERHKKEGIHAHVLITNKELHQAVEKDWKKWSHIIDNRRRVDRILKDPTTWHWQEFVQHCTQVGFGPRCFAQPMRSGTGERMAAYLGKLAKELTGAGKDYQIPVDAPPHFRRLRASQGLLPPIFKSDMTGYLICKPFPAGDACEEV